MFQISRSSITVCVFVKVNAKPILAYIKAVLCITYGKSMTFYKQTNNKNKNKTINRPVKL